MAKSTKANETNTSNSESETCTTCKSDGTSSNPFEIENPADWRVIEADGCRIWDDSQRPPTKKRALLIFSKYPEAGKVKTRLTYLKGGPFMPEAAADFFKCSLFDVVEGSMVALQELQAINDSVCLEDPTHYHVQYDFFMSTTPAAQLDKMKDLMSTEQFPMPINFITDSGTTFDEHFNDAFQQLFDMGYESVVSVGGDIPTMPKTHITEAFRWLAWFDSNNTPGFVQAPCQECGTSLVGYSKNTPIDHLGVYYNLDGTPALDAYVEKLKEKDIPCAYLSPVADIDEQTDLYHAISCMRAMAQAAPYQRDIHVPWRTLKWVNEARIKVITPPNDEHDPRQYMDGVELEDAYVAHKAKKEESGE